MPCEASPLKRNEPLSPYCARCRWWSIQTPPNDSASAYFSVWLLSPEDEGAQLIAGDDIDGPVFVQVRGQYSRTHAGTRINQLRLKARSSGRLGITNRLIPVENRGTERIGIQIVGVVGPIPFSYDEIGDPI